MSRRRSSARCIWRRVMVTSAILLLLFNGSKSNKRLPASHCRQFTVYWRDAMEFLKSHTMDDDERYTFRAAGYNKGCPRRQSGEDHRSQPTGLGETNNLLYVSHQVRVEDR